MPHDEPDPSAVQERLARLRTAATWTPEEIAEFAVALAEQRRVDDSSQWESDDGAPAQTG